MIINDIDFTPKALMLIKYADIIAKQSNFNVIHPVHLFLAALKIDSDVNNELKTLISVDIVAIEQQLNLLIPQKNMNNYVQINVKNSTLINISTITKDIILEAKRLSMLSEEHGQIFVNDGQILSVVLNCDDTVTRVCLSNLNKDLIISIIASPRNMIVNLNNNFNIDCTEDVYIRKVNGSDKDMVREFVLKNFYERWTNTIDYGLSLTDIPIYIATINDNIVGFAGYNISKQRKGYFGPLGVLREFRDRKIGQALLNSCLLEMKYLDYRTCIIGNASSIEFYEKSCGAKIIPIINL